MSIDFFGSEFIEQSKPKELITSRADIVTQMMAIAIATSMRGTCCDRAVGCVFTYENKIVATGYNGSPAGDPHCIDVGCLHDQNGRCMRCVHAESNACLQLAGRPADTAYLTLYPCLSCFRQMRQAGIKTVYYWKHRDDRDVCLYLDEITSTLQPNPLVQVPDRLIGLLESLNSEMRGHIR